MDPSFLRKLGLTLLTLFGLALMLAALWMLAETTQREATDFDRLHDWLLGFNILGVALLVILLGFNLGHLIIQYRARRPGSRLTARFVGVFAVLALVPVILVFYFSLQFITKGIDSWFDVRIESALEESLALSRAALESRMRDQEAQTEVVAQNVAGLSMDVLASRLESYRRELEATELTVFSSDGQILATSGEFGRGFLPSQPPRELISQARRSGSYVGLDSPEAEGELIHVRALVTLPEPERLASPRILQARFPVPARQSQLAERVQTAWQQYRELDFYRAPIRISFVLTLSLVLLLSLLLAIVGAFHFARRLVAPIQDLAAGTRAVARGELDTRLPLRAHDEVGFLALSFNEMTRRLQEAREQAARSRREVEAERAYLEAVLARLTSGVIALDSDLKIRAANAAAEQILELELLPETGRPLMELAGTSPRLKVLADRVMAHIHQGDAEWHEELALPGRTLRRLLICRCKALPFPGEDEPGHVIVFDDITMLVQAQRDSAWGEVARRLAHEIRNPLTPIQLAAERIRHKYLERVDDAGTLDRATHTIVQQVEALKAMVKAFSDYARSPDLEFTLLDINQLIMEVADLYRGLDDGPHLSLDLDTDLPRVRADAGRIRQALHNLVRNAQEASRSEDGARVRIVSRRLVSDVQTDQVEVVVEDDGPGFGDDMGNTVFEPYVTTKPKGTGLGLAIVKKLVEEHGGLIRAGNREAGGAQIIMQIPINAPMETS
ncbi:nitrogen fixation/metabolism regulation signal transduction histidine kinase [Natronospira proteinivora]|uniref:histidine kinase n=1 Tax=Natronospira proteinivora TaxID=1807133 RepID=A0ABT1G9T7_9GAMM|nr:nitrogen fixation/metabolism regulation signal transduction histidine kinase [Natronospira proteinivora]